MTPEETQHYVHLGIEAVVKSSAATVHMRIQEMERALQEAGGQVYTSARFAPQVSALREALDAFEQAIVTKEKQFAPQVAGRRQDAGVVLSPGPVLPASETPGASLVADSVRQQQADVPNRT